MKDFVLVLSVVFFILLCIVLYIVSINAVIGNKRTYGNVLWNILFSFIILFGLLQFINIVYSSDPYVSKVPEVKVGKHDRCIGSVFLKDDILGDFHMLGSHNTCAVKVSDGFVNKDMLKKIIKVGVRYLDFEIYSIKGKTMVSASSDENDGICFKSTFNEIPIEEVLEVVYSNAFTSQFKEEPLFVQFRIRSSQKMVYRDLANAISKQLKERILEPRYAYNCEKLMSSGRDYIENQPMTHFKERVVVVVHDPFGIIKSTPLYEFTNILLPQKSIFRASDISPDLHTRKTYALNNKTQFSCILPSIRDGKTKHYKYELASGIGFHAVCVDFWNQDANFNKVIENIFKTDGGAHAFVKRNKENLAERIVVKAKVVSVPGARKPSTSKFNWFGVEEDYTSP